MKENASSSSPSDMIHFFFFPFLARWIFLFSLPFCAGVVAANPLGAQVAGSIETFEYEIWKFFLPVNWRAVQKCSSPFLIVASCWVSAMIVEGGGRWWGGWKIVLTIFFVLPFFWAAQSLSFGHVKCAGLNASGIPFSLFVHLLHFFLLFFQNSFTKKNTSNRGELEKHEKLFGVYF